jgi:xylulokinase
LEKQRSIEQLFLITGQRIDPSFGSIKWMWLCQNHPDVAKHTHRWLSVPDYIFWRLTGSQATDYTLASRTLLLDQRKLDWSQEMLELVGLKYNQLPPIFPSGSLVGKVTRQASGECGLRYGTPCYLGGHDHLCAALAGGASHAGVAIDSSGTAQAILITLPTFLSDPRIPEKGYACYAHVVPGLYILKAGLKAAGGAIDWLVRQLAGLNAGEKDLPFAELERAAIEGVGKHVGPLWLPHFIGSGSPDGDRFSQGALIGIQLHHSQGDIFRGLLEGLAFWSKDNIETMQELSGQVIKQGFALGGLTRIALLTQLKADILNIPVAVPKIPEASATGAALLAALGCGYFNSPDEAVGSICYDHIIYAPHPERVDWYENLFRRVYKQMYPALAKINKDLDTLRNLPPQYKGNTKSN